MNSKYTLRFGKVCEAGYYLKMNKVNIAPGHANNVTLSIWRKRSSE
jgi:hypothetical protein